MKQVKCWAYVRDDTKEIVAVSFGGKKPSVDTRFGQLVELTGTLPDPGRWVKGEPDSTGEWWRWCTDASTPCALQNFWDGQRWTPARSFDAPCTNVYAPYYWTGSDKPTEAPPSEPEKTCEVRWSDANQRWESEWQGAARIHVVHSKELSKLIDECRRSGFRITNDPREVVLWQHSDGWHANYYDADGNMEGNPGNAALPLDEWRRIVAERGWRILREESAERRPTLGEMVERFGRAIPANAPAGTLELFELALRIVEALGRDRH